MHCLFLKCLTFRSLNNTPCDEIRKHKQPLYIDTICSDISLYFVWHALKKYYVADNIKKYVFRMVLDFDRSSSWLCGYNSVHTVRLEFLLRVLLCQARR